MPRGFFKYALLSIIAQLVICTSTWVATVVFTPIIDSAFEAMVYFYWPSVLLVSTILESSGQPSMIAGPLFGMLFGILIYGAIAGLMIQS